MTENDPTLELEEEEIIAETNIQNSNQKVVKADSKLNLNEPPESLWRYFEQPKTVAQTHILCLLCNKKYSRGTDQSTSPLRKHLKSIHDKHYKEYKAAMEKAKEEQKLKPAILTPKRVPKPPGQLTLMECQKSAEKLPNKDPRSIEMDEKILKYMCYNCEPLSMTERPDFKEMINCGFPRYQVKGRTFMTGMVENKFRECLGQIKQMVQDEVISLTMDTWSNKNGDKSFLNITAHWISDEFTREFVIVDTAPLDAFESHTGEYLRTIVDNFIDEYSFPRENVHLILRDAAAVMRKTARILGIESFDCFIHMIQLAINDGLKLPEIDPIIKNAKRIITHFDHSSDFRKVFYQTQSKLEEPELGLIQDCVTRWNSTFYAIERLLKCKKVLSCVAVDYTKCSALLEIDWIKLKEIEQILSPFEKITKGFSERNESISSVLPAYNALTTQLATKNNLFCSTIAEGLNSRMGPFSREKFILISTLIDPRFKNGGFSSETERKLACSLLESELMSLESNGATPPPPKRRHISDNAADPIAQFLGAFEPVSEIASTSQAAIAAKMELDQFLLDGIIKRDGDPLFYWKNKGMWPNLQKIVRRYLAAPPSSVESERVFSTLGGIYKPNRSRLSGEHAKAQLFLHHHL